MIKDEPNHTNHINKLQSSYCLVVHENAHLSYKRYKVKKPCFNGHLRYTSTSIHKHTLFLYFLNSPSPSFFFIFKINIKQSIKTNKTPKTRLIQTTTINHAWDQESEGITWNIFPSRWETWMENVSFA